jgi:hypothetical protein
VRPRHRVNAAQGGHVAAAPRAHTWAASGLLGPGKDARTQRGAHGADAGATQRRRVTAVARWPMPWRARYGHRHGSIPHMTRRPEGSVQAATRAWRARAAEASRSCDVALRRGSGGSGRSAVRRDEVSSHGSARQQPEVARPQASCGPPKDCPGPSDAATRA